MAKRISGTREWASVNANCFTGCPHNCRYCYAENDAVNRFKKVKEKDWTKPVVNKLALKRKWGKRKGIIMFPTTHDITPEMLPECLTFLGNILVSKNNVLIVSKPHFECIKEICSQFEVYRDQIMFRFTIGADDSEILKYWEPNAPSFEERLKCLKYAFDKGFRTSVSVEPMLDSPRIFELFKKLEPFTTDSIWIGMMNKIPDRVERKAQTQEDKYRIEAIKKGQTPNRVRVIFNILNGHPLVQWKESFKTILGIPEGQEKWE